jgi:hypothetical protein
MINDETRLRFLTAIRDKVALEGGAIEEAHVFQSMKQGIMETGVAVVAAAATEPLPIGAEGAAEHIDPASQTPAEYSVDNAPLHDRRIVYTARYRLTLKGPDRGKWEFSIHPEADAPLVTVDKVVRGVQQRSGDSMEPTKLSGEEIRAMVPQPEAQPAQL